jgi:hypothetical protein
MSYSKINTLMAQMALLKVRLKCAPLGTRCERKNFRCWHIASIRTCALNGRYRRQSGQLSSQSTRQERDDEEDIQWG